MTTVLFNYRKAFHDFVISSRFEVGIIYFQKAYEQIIYGEPASDFTMEAVAEVYCMRYRLSIFQGDFSQIKSGIEFFYTQHGEDLPVRARAELAFLAAAQNYHEGYYTSAYRSMMEYIDGCRKNVATNLSYCDYLLQRIHLFSAKLSWRQEDFFLARIHIGLSQYHYNQFNKSFRVKTGKEYFLLGRIYTVYTRLLVQRRGPGEENQNYQNPEKPLLNTNAHAAERALEAADLFFQSTCPLQVVEEDKRGNRGHAFFLEIDELKAVNYRNQARLIARDSSIKAKELYAKAEKLLSDSLNTIERIFQNADANRRVAHLYRLRAENTLIRLLGRVRSGKSFTTEDREQLDQGISDLIKEGQIREKTFEGKRHVTRARNVNNQALFTLIKAHTYEILATGPSRSLYEDVIKFAHRAMKVNGAESIRVDELQKKVTDAISDPEKWPFMSGLQMISSIGCVLEGKLRLTQTTQPEQLPDLLDEFNEWYQLAWEINKLVSQGYNSISAREDLGRQIRPVHEAVLELCYLTIDQNGKFNKMQRRLIFSVYLRAIAPTVKDRIDLDRYGVGEKDLPAKTPLSIERYSAEVKAINAIVEQMNSGVMQAPYPHNQEIVEELYENLKKDKKRNFKNGKSINVQQLKNAFNGTPGGVVNFFMGARHCYIFYYGGVDQKINWGLGLVRCTEKDFRDISILKSYVKRLRSILVLLLNKVDIFCTEEIQKLQSPGNISEDTEEEKQRLKQNKVIYNRELVDLLRGLYQKLFGNLPMQEHIKRYYIIPDNELWDIPWPMLITEEPKQSLNQGFNFKDFEYLSTKYRLSLHATLNTWKTIDDLKVHGDVRKVFNYYGAWSGRFLLEGIMNSEANRFKKAIYDAAAIISGLDKKYKTRKDEELYRALEHAQFFDTFGKRKEEMNANKFYDGLSSTSIFHFAGHEKESKDQHLYKRGLNLLEVEGEPVYMTQFAIEGMRLPNLELVILDSCRAGAGTRETGNLPRALSNAFLYTGVRNMLYGLYDLPTASSKHFVDIFLEKLAEGKAIGEAYQYAQHELIRDENAHPCQWGLLQLMANQNHKIVFEAPL